MCVSGEGVRRAGPGVTESPTYGRARRARADAGHLSAFTPRSAPSLWVVESDADSMVKARHVPCVPRRGIYRHSMLQALPTPSREAKMSDENHTAVVAQM